MLELVYVFQDESDLVCVVEILSSPLDCLISSPKLGLKKAKRINRGESVLITSVFPSRHG